MVLLQEAFITAPNDPGEITLRQNKKSVFASCFPNFDEDVSQLIVEV